MVNMKLILCRTIFPLLRTQKHKIKIKSYQKDIADTIYLLDVIISSESKIKFI